MSKKVRHYWTTQDIDKLERLYEDPKYSILEIAQLLERTYNSVVIKANREGFSRPITVIQRYYLTPITYDPLTNKLTVHRPTDIDELLTKIIQIKNGGDLEK